RINHTFLLREAPPISATNSLTFPLAIPQYYGIAHMRTLPCLAKSYSFKIFPLNPYCSKILVLSPVQVHCFHRPEGEGGTSFLHKRKTVARTWRRGNQRMVHAT